MDPKNQDTTDEKDFADDAGDNTETLEVDVGDELEVEIVDDTPERDKGRRPLAKPVQDPTDEELAQYSKGAQLRINELTHARHDERRKAEQMERELAEAQRVARALYDQNKQLRTVVETGTKAFNENAVKVAETELDAAKRKLREAQDSYDNDLIVAAQDELAQARYKLERVKEQPAAPLQAVPDVVKTTQPQSRQNQIDETSLRWQQKNQWFGADGYEEVTGFALALDAKLRKQGYNPRSQEFFEQIDARVREKFPEVAEPRGSTSAKPKPPSAPSVVAPVTRASSGGRVRLTSTQVALAAKLGLTPQQYAVELAKLEKADAR